MRIFPLVFSHPVNSSFRFYVEVNQLRKVNDLNTRRLIMDSIHKSIEEMKQSDFPAGGQDFIHYMPLWLMCCE